MPADRPGLIDRSALVDELVAASDRRVIALSAPVGFGKRTLLAVAGSPRRPPVRLGLARSGRRKRLAALHPHRRRRPHARHPVRRVQRRDARHLGHRSSGTVARRRLDAAHERHRARRPQHPRGARQRGTRRTRSPGRPPPHPRPTRGVEPPAGAAGRSARRARGAVLELGPSDLGFTGEEVTSLLELTPGAPLPNELGGKHHVVHRGMARRRVPVIARAPTPPLLRIERPAPRHRGDQLGDDR